MSRLFIRPPTHKKTSELRLIRPFHSKVCAQMEPCYQCLRYFHLDVNNCHKEVIYEFKNGVHILSTVQPPPPRGDHPPHGTYIRWSLRTCRARMKKSRSFRRQNVRFLTSLGHIE